MNFQPKTCQKNINKNQQNPAKIISVDGKIGVKRQKKIKKLPKCGKMQQNEENAENVGNCGAQRPPPG